MVRIGMSFWGSLEKPSRSSGTATTLFSAVGERHLLVDELLARGADVTLLQERRERDPYPGVAYASDSFPELDCLYAEWRWPTSKNSGATKSEPDWDRQVKLLNEYSRRGIPILVFDTDMKVRAQDEFRWPRMVIGEPTIVRSFVTKKRIRLNWATDLAPYFPDRSDEPTSGYAYLGNNYERIEQFSRLYGDPSGPLREMGIPTIVHGNWLERAEGRESPEEILRRFPRVDFRPRLSYMDGMRMMSRALCVSSLAKAEYCRHGFITSRVYESILCGVPCLIPNEHEHLLPMGLGDWLVGSGAEVVEKVSRLRGMSSESRGDIVNRQREALLRLGDFTPARKVDTILAVADRTITQERIDGGELG